MEPDDVVTVTIRLTRSGMEKLRTALDDSYYWHDGVMRKYDLTESAGLRHTLAVIDIARWRVEEALEKERA